MAPHRFLGVNCAPCVVQFVCLRHQGTIALPVGGYKQALFSDSMHANRTRGAKPHKQFDFQGSILKIKYTCLLIHHKVDLHVDKKHTVIWGDDASSIQCAT